MSDRLKKSGTVLLGGALLMSALVSMHSCAGESNVHITMPRAFSIVVDDMGWNEGSSLGDSGGPWRTGVRRRFDVNDYRAVVDLGKAMGMRLQGVFILSEMDREGIVSEYPTATQAGAAFDNSANVNDVQLEVMQYVKDNAAYLEFGLHGVGHEHWEDGIRTRAEWYDLENDQPWAEQDGRDHVELYRRIMAQYGWTAENGQSFPESFVPCAYGYYWNPGGDYSTGSLLAEYGVKYGNTEFREIMELTPPLEFGGGFDNGLLVLQRNNYGNEWNAWASLPTVPIDSFETDLIETHWPNLLAQDYDLQADLTSQWVDIFKRIQARPDRYLAKNTQQLSSQWLYNRYTVVNEVEPGSVEIDNTLMPDDAYSTGFLGNLVLAIRLEAGQHVAAGELDGQPVPAILEDGEYAYLYLPPLQQRTYRFTYTIGDQIIPLVVNHTGTYNVYSLSRQGTAVELRIEMYGTQEVELRLPSRPTAVSSDNPHLHIQDWNYDETAKMLSMTVYGRDMQGETGTITVSR